MASQHYPTNGDVLIHYNYLSRFCDKTIRKLLQTYLFGNCVLNICKYLNFIAFEIRL